MPSLNSALRRAKASARAGCAVATAAAFLMSSAFSLMPARAEVSEIKIADQVSFAFLEINVMKHENLVEKHAAALGMPDLKVDYILFTRAADAMNDALFSHALDFGVTGVTALFTAWARTVGTPQELRGVSGLGSFSLSLTSQNPALKSITDYKPDNKIAVPGVKSSLQAMILEMAVAKQWGIQNYDKLDPQTFTMSDPDATVAILAGGNTVETSFASPPFTQMQLKDPKIHVVLASTDVIGDASTAVFYTSKAFHDANPTVYKAVYEAVKDADAFIRSNMPQALAYYVEDTQSKMSAEDLLPVATSPGMTYSIVPRGMMMYADFMSKTGRIPKAPTRWQDLFFPEAYDLPGN